MCAILPFLIFIFFCISLFKVLCFIVFKICFHGYICVSVNGVNSGQEKAKLFLENWLRKIFTSREWGTLAWTIR